MYLELSVIILGVHFSDQILLFEDASHPGAYYFSYRAPHLRTVWCVCGWGGGRLEAKNPCQETQSIYTNLGDRIPHPQTLLGNRDESKSWTRCSWYVIRAKNRIGSRNDVLLRICKTSAKTVFSTKNQMSTTSFFCSFTYCLCALPYQSRSHAPQLNTVNAKFTVAQIPQNANVFSAQKPIAFQMI